MEAEFFLPSSCPGQPQVATGPGRCQDHTWLPGGHWGETHWVIHSLGQGWGWPMPSSCKRNLGKEWSKLQEKVKTDALLAQNDILSAIGKMGHNSLVLRELSGIYFYFKIIPDLGKSWNRTKNSHDSFTQIPQMLIVCLHHICCVILSAWMDP